MLIESSECVFDYGRAYTSSLYACGRCATGHTIRPTIASAGLQRVSSGALVTVNFLLGAFINRTVSRTVAYHAIIEQQAAMIAHQGTPGCEDLAQKLRSNEKNLSRLIMHYHFSRDNNSDWRFSLTCSCKHDLVAVSIDGTGSGVHTRCGLFHSLPTDDASDIFTALPAGARLVLPNSGQNSSLRDDLNLFCSSQGRSRSDFPAALARIKAAVAAPDKHAVLRAGLFLFEEPCTFATGPLPSVSRLVQCLVSPHSPTSLLRGPESYDVLSRLAATPDGGDVTASDSDILERKAPILLQFLSEVKRFSVVSESNMRVFFNRFRIFCGTLTLWIDAWMNGCTFPAPALPAESQLDGMHDVSAERPHDMVRDWFRFGVLSSLPRVRDRRKYGADVDGRMKKEHDFCHKTPNTGEPRSRILMVYVCMICDQVVGIQSSDSNETPRLAFEFLLAHCLKAPKLICYDNACNFNYYCMLREPKFFGDSIFAIDRFHVGVRVLKLVLFDSMLLPQALTPCSPIFLDYLFVNHAESCQLLLARFQH